MKQSLFSKIVPLILNEYLRFEWFVAPPEPDPHHDWLLALLVKGIADSAQLLKLSFRSHLMHCLYNLIECLGNENQVVSQAALSSLLRISFCCNYGSITNMITQNVDYLIDSIAFRLRNFNFQDFNAPLMLLVLIVNFSSLFQALLTKTGLKADVIILLSIILMICVIYCR